MSRLPATKPSESYCPECNSRITTGPTGIEYGHARGRSRNSRGRCPRRPDCVDPDRPGPERKEWSA